VARSSTGGEGFGGHAEQQGAGDAAAVGQQFGPGGEFEGFE
jgi:hypothetical protein